MSGPAGAAGATFIPDPTRLEAGAQRLVNNHVLSPLYRSWVGRLGLRGDERVLDFGSGGGGEARHLARRLAAGRLTCMDISPGWQRVARRVLRGYEVSYLLGDARDLVVAPSSFDLIVIHWALHDVPGIDRPRVLAALVGWLRPGGRIAIREPASARHGVAPAVVKGLLSDAGLVETRGEAGRLPILGPFYDGVWQKPG